MHHDYLFNFTFSALIASIVMTFLKVMFPHSVSFHYFSFLCETVVCQGKGAWIILGLLSVGTPIQGRCVSANVPQQRFKNDFHEYSALVITMG